MGRYVRRLSRRQRDARYWAGEARRFPGRARRFERWMQRYHQRAARRLAVLAELEDWDWELADAPAPGEAGCGAFAPRWKGRR